MSALTHTCKIPIVNSDSLCIINSEWSSSDIKLMLLHENNAWSGKFQLIENEDITELLDQLSLSEHAYVEESRKALTSHGGIENFTYSLENGMFTWKKCVRKDISIKFGNVNLIKVPLFEAFEKVVDDTIQSNFTFFTKLETVEKQRESLEKENNTLKSKLNELVGKKNEMEETLYSQFLHLLNEKKRKIKELRKKIPTEGIEDSVLSESDHFDSDTEIDSEEEKSTGSTFKGSSLEVEDKPVILSKRPRQKRSTEPIAGPSGEHSKAKNLKTVLPNKQAVNGKRGKEKSVKDSCVMGKIPKTEDTILSEGSEDAFTFKRSPKKAVCGVQPTRSKITYESDEDTDVDNKKDLNEVCDMNEALNRNEDFDSDKTPSQIDPQEIVGGSMNSKPLESDRTKNYSLKQETSGGSKSNTCDESKGQSFNSESSKKKGYRGLSSSTLEILNQLV